MIIRVEQTEVLVAMARKQSESGFYHVFSRGVCRQIIFEDDEDRLRLLDYLRRFAPELVEIHAWCLMDNHYHLILRGTCENRARFLAKVNGTYTKYYNVRHGRVGHLFQGSYGCEPIDGEAYLLAAIKYVHRNPMEAGLSEDCWYRWSSFAAYTQGASNALCTTDFVLGLLGSTDAFCDFHENECEEHLMDMDGEKDRLSKDVADAVAIAAGNEEFGEGWRKAILTLDRATRDAWLRRLKVRGLSVRQIERLTGIGRNIVVDAGHAG